MGPPMKAKAQLAKLSSIQFLTAALLGQPVEFRDLLQPDLLALASRHELYVCWLGIEAQQEQKTDLHEVLTQWP